MGISTDEWIDRYRRAWLEADSGLVASLFTSDGIYCWHLTEPPAVGREAIEEYWSRTCSTQDDVDLAFGSPILGGRRTVLEFWATMRESGSEVTLPGCMLLQFDAEGLCAELREYWYSEPGRLTPPDLWGR